MKVCRCLLSKIRAEMFRPKPIPLLFIFNKEQIVSLHTFFVMKPIDIAFVDGKAKVSRIIRSLRPWKFCSGNARYIIEMPSGTMKLRTGETIDIASMLNPNS